jgi:opacity protein-like surface antigen
MIRPLLALAFVLSLACVHMPGQTPKSYLPVSISYLVPVTTVADSLEVQPGVGFSVGYQFAPDRHWRIGARGTWMWSGLATTSGTEIEDYSVTFYQILATVQWKLFKHGFTPYLQAEGGLGFLNLDEMIGNVPVRVEGASTVRSSAGASLGVLIPVSDMLDVDVSGRYSHTFVDDGYGLAGVHVGVVYCLTR